MAVDWERVKENAQPLRSGYRAGELAELLQSPHSDTTRAKLELAMKYAHSHCADTLQHRFTPRCLLGLTRQFEARIATNEGADPLAAWKEYVAAAAS